MKNCNLLYDVIAAHLLWLETSGISGKRADLKGADLRWANLREANLRKANLREANLRKANLREADLEGADLKRANLEGADLRWANLREANLREANLRKANLVGANLDFSSGIPFHCGGTVAKGDDCLFAQILYHLTRQDWSNCSKEVLEAIKIINNIRSASGDKIVDLFCKYRKDVKILN